MAPSRPKVSPLDAFVDTAGPSLVKALKALGNETRLAILLALWESEEVPTSASDIAPQTLSFSELVARVGMRDSGQFSYHLNQLVGSFVDHDDAGYRLNPRAQPILGQLLAGWFQGEASFEAEPTGRACTLCGEPLVADYRDGILLIRCTNCAGRVSAPDLPEGTMEWGYRAPAGFAGRTPQEFIRLTNVLYRHQCQSLAEGVCPVCSGAVAVRCDICDDHEAETGRPCSVCGSVDAMQWVFTCSVCRVVLSTPIEFPPTYTDPDVMAFFHDHGADATRLYATDGARVFRESLQGSELIRREPLRVRVTFAIEGDRLEVTLDENAKVVGVNENGS